MRTSSPRCRGGGGGWRIHCSSHPPSGALGSVHDVRIVLTELLGDLEAEEDAGSEEDQGSELHDATAYPCSLAAPSASAAPRVRRSVSTAQEMNRKPRAAISAARAGSGAWIAGISPAAIAVSRIASRYSRSC